ncbi:MAG TPA: flagellar biosynthetic protein FliR [Terriglobia bacterium]|nr:flagellar biosynthetic protein FliR [Terriglobia bacterium]
METLIVHTVEKATLIGARISMLFVFAPFFGSAAIPLPVKAGLTVAVTAVLYPVLGAMPHVAGVAGWMEILIGEAMVGLIIGLIMNFVFEGVEMAGEVVGFQLGFSLETAIDPTTQAASPALSVFYQLLALLFFIQLDMHEWMLVSLAKSYEYLPVGAARLGQAGAAHLLEASGSIFLIGIEMGAPIILATFLTDLALGFLNKAVPQFPVTFTAISVKNLLGFALMVITFGLWPELLKGYFDRALLVTQHVLHLL